MKCRGVAVGVPLRTQLSNAVDAYADRKSVPSGTRSPHPVGLRRNRSFALVAPSQRGEFRSKTQLGARQRRHSSLRASLHGVYPAWSGRRRLPRASRGVIFDSPSLLNFELSTFNLFRMNTYETPSHLFILKDLCEVLSPLESALTKNRGRGVTQKSVRHAPGPNARGSLLPHAPNGSLTSYPGKEGFAFRLRLMTYNLQLRTKDCRQGVVVFP